MNILECQDKDGLVICCTKDTWVNHIITEHPEMEGCEAHVKAVIEHPYQIYQDSTNLNKKVIYNPAVLPKASHSRYLRVVVEYRSSKFRGLRGYVCTAFACWNKGKTDILIWERK